MHAGMNVGDCSGCHTARVDPHNVGVGVMDEEAEKFTAMWDEPPMIPILIIKSVEV